MNEHLYFFSGIDPAPSESHRSDDGAIVNGCARPKRLPDKDHPLSMHESDWYFDFIYARRMTWKEKASARQWSGIIHRQHELFRFEKIVMDPNQGGTYIARELINPQQLINGSDRMVIPIADQDNGPRRVAVGHFILHLWKRGDPGVEAIWPKLSGDDVLNDILYSNFKEAIDHGLVAWPAPVEEWKAERQAELRQWPEERQWAVTNLDACVAQCKNIMVAMKEDGLTFDLTKRGARRFAALGKKDLVSAAMYCYAGFLMWLKSGDWGAMMDPEDAKMFSSW